MYRSSQNNPYASNTTSASSSSHGNTATSDPISGYNYNNDHDHDHDNRGFPDNHNHNDNLGHGRAISPDQDSIDILDDDPLRGDLTAPISFKRRQAPSFFSGSSRLFSIFTGSRTNPSAQSSRGASPAIFAESRAPPQSEPSGFNASTKDAMPLDWYAEGPGRRVGYEDLTAIDWIFEYTKERQRLRVLASSASGLMGYVRRLLDASQVWVVLLLTGMAVGAIAAGIDVTTDWLGDLKLGYCSSGPEGGHFYLNKAFCCYGYDQGSNCDGWKPWGQALGVQSAGKRWFVEYLFFVTFSVGFDKSIPADAIISDIDLQDIARIPRRSLRARVRHLRQAQWYS